MPLYKKLRYDENKEFSLRTVKNLLALRKGRIEQNIPDRTLKKTLLLATWNIRDFDSNKFKQGPRLPESYHYLAEVISNFDLVALQEINEDLRPLKEIKRILGGHWDFITTDVNSASGGNQERLAFIFDKRKVFFRKVAGEIIIPKKDLAKGVEETFDLPKGNEVVIEEDITYTNTDGELITLKKGDIINLPKKSHKINIPDGQNLIRKQLVRTPFMVSFQSGWFKFNLCTAHILYGGKYGKGKRRRVKEIRSLAKYLKRKSEEFYETYKTSEHFIMLGDFNVVSETDDTYKALTKNKFQMPQGIYLTNQKGDMAYDQIAFAPVKDKMRYTGKSGIFDFYKYVFKNSDRTVYDEWMKDKTDDGVKYTDMSQEQKEKYYESYWRTFQMSDHLPLWVELEIDFSDEYLLETKYEIVTNTLSNPVVD